MELSINRILSAVIKIIWLNDEMFALQICIRGPYQELRKIQPIIKNALFDKKSLCISETLFPENRELLEMTAVQCTHMKFIDALRFLGYDVQETWPESVAERRQKVMGSGTLEKALELAFDFLPLGEKMTGPKGKITLSRNDLLKDSPGIATVSVLDAEKNDGKIIFTAYWERATDYYTLQFFWGDKIEDWSDKW